MEIIATTLDLLQCEKYFFLGMFTTYNIVLNYKLIQITHSVYCKSF